MTDEFRQGYISGAIAANEHFIKIADQIEKSYQGGKLDVVQIALGLVRRNARENIEILSKEKQHENS